jgi:c-di-GMP-binding flagellar brake protein YcgR
MSSDAQPRRVRVGIRFLGVDAPMESTLARVIFQAMSLDAHRRRHLRGMQRLAGDPRERRDAYRVPIDGPRACAELVATVDTTSAQPPRAWQGQVCDLSLSGCAVCIAAGSAPAPGSVLELRLRSAALELRGIVVYLMEVD